VDEFEDERIAIVGAGPGDPELLTLKAARLIGAADIVLFDRLVSSSILSLAPTGADLVDVGKIPGGSHTQDLVNDALVAAARSGRRVVRLKGGDPFVFGRGGEEVEVLAAHGFGCVVVPGISSALAAPASVGIPVTHRTISRAVTIVTGHEAIASSPVNWSALAQVGSTLVVLMGVERRASIAGTLIDAGMASTMPVAVVMRASTPEQSVWTGRLDQLADADVSSPAVMVIGAVAAFADHAADHAAAALRTD